MRHSAKHCIARLSALARCTAVPELNTLAKFTQTCGPLSLVQTNHLFDLAFSETAREPAEPALKRAGTRPVTCSGPL